MSDGFRSLDVSEMHFNDIKEGQKMVVIKHKGQLILQKIDKYSKNLEQDLIFAKRTEEAYKKIESGKGIKMDGDKFLQEL